MMIHGYGLIVGTAIAVGWWWLSKKATGWGVEQKLVESASTWAVGLGIVGARLYHVIDYWHYYVVEPIRIIWVWQGGLGIWGAIVGGLLGIVVATGTRKEKTLVLLDAAAAAMPLSQAIGRWGNWVNGELYGKGGAPLFVYESGLNLLLFWLINFRSTYKHKGQILGEYLIGYGCIRVGLEFWRVDPWRWGGIPVAVWLGGGAIIMGGILMRKPLWKQK